MACGTPRHAGPTAHAVGLPRAPRNRRAVSSKPKAVRPGTRHAIAPDAVAPPHVIEPKTLHGTPRRSHGSRRWASTGTSPRRVTSEGLPTPRETASLASEARMAKRSQCRASQRAGCPTRASGDEVWATPKRATTQAHPKRPKPEPTPGRWRRRERQRVGNPEACHYTSAPPCDERGVAHASGDGVIGKRSQDGEAKPMPSEPKGRMPDASVRRRGVGNPEACHYTSAPQSPQAGADAGTAATARQPASGDRLRLRLEIVLRVGRRGE